MKSIVIYKTILLLCIATAFSCSNDSSNEEPVMDYGTVSFKINGSSRVLKPISPVDDNNNDFFSISGYNCDYGIQMKLNFPPTVGSYSYGEEDYLYAVVWIGDFFPCEPLFGANSGFTVYTSKEGSITITELTAQRIKGGFHCIVETSFGETQDITDGVFNILRE